MRRNLLAALALSAVLALGIAVAAYAAQITVQAGNLKLTFGGTVSPKGLPKKKLKPIALNVNGKIQTTDGTHPPALREAIVDIDKNGAVNSKGVPVCKRGELEARDTKCSEAGLRRGGRRQRQHPHRDRLPRTAADQGHQPADPVQRRHQGRQDDDVHPRVHHRAGPGGGRHHADRQEDPQGPLRLPHDRQGPGDRRWQRLGAGLQVLVQQEEVQPTRARSTRIWKRSARTGTTTPT